MTSGEHPEIDIDRRLGGDLSEAESAALDAHLAICARCRGYEKAAREMMLDLRAASNEVSETIDWDRLEKSIERQRGARITRLAAGAGLGVIAVALSTWGFAPPGEAWLYVTGIGALVAALVGSQALLVLREHRDVARLARGDELLAGQRSLLIRRIRTIRRFRWVALAVVLWCLWSAAQWREGRPVVVYLGLAAIVALSWLHTLVFAYPRLRSELAELGSDAGR